jgi:hypothetical protein
MALDPQHRATMLFKWLGLIQTSSYNSDQGGGDRLTTAEMNLENIGGVRSVTKYKQQQQQQLQLQLEQQKQKQKQKQQEQQERLPFGVSKWLERATSAKRADGEFGTSRTDAKQVVDDDVDVVEGC